MTGEAREQRGLPFRALAPNAITALALCFGLTGVRFAISEEWGWAVGCVIIAGVLDGLDGRVARLLRANSRFGAELDSLSDVTAFGVAPSFILYLWSLQFAPDFGWVAAITLAVCCALRLARFNARLDVEDQPRKLAGYLTGVPAPAGAGLAFVPVYLWLVTGESLFREWYVVMPWAIAVALLMISTIATYSWSSLRIRRSSRLVAIGGIGLLGAAAVTNPWITLLGISLMYLAMLPFGVASYARLKRRRATGPQPAQAAGPDPVR